MVLGKRFEPGSDNAHFCKPAAVSVMKSGDFFVADGYCNSRVIKFNSRGEKILEWGRAYQPSMFSGVSSWFSRIAPPPYAFQIPHALALAEDQDLLCVADRENGRIQCFKASTGEFEFKIESLDFGGRLFSVAYSPVNGKKLFIMNQNLNDKSDYIYKIKRCACRYSGGTLVAVNGPNGRFSSKPVQGFIIPLATREISSVFKPESPQAFGNPHDVAISRDGKDIYVVEITQPYKVWKFSNNSTSSYGAISGKQINVGASHLEKRPETQEQPSPHSHSLPDGTSSESVALPHSDVNEAPSEDSFGASVVIMAFLTIPLLLLIGIGALMRLRDSGIPFHLFACQNYILCKHLPCKNLISKFIISTGCCRRKETKSFSEFFPPSAGFEKLRMDESDSENSDTEIEEFNASMYRKTSA